MANTFVSRLEVLLEGEKLIEAQMSSTSSDSNVIRISVAAEGTYAFTGGTNATIITNNLAAGIVIPLTINAVDYDLGSVAVLPGNLGSVTITNDTDGSLDFEIAIIN